MSHCWCYKEGFQSFNISLICIYIKNNHDFIPHRKVTEDSQNKLGLSAEVVLLLTKECFIPSREACRVFACTHSLSYILTIVVSIYASQKTYRNKVWKYWAPTERQKRMLAKESRICKVCYKCQFSNFKQCCQNNFKLPLWFFPHRNAYTRRKLAVHLALGFASTVKLLECFKRDRGRDHYIYKTVLWKNNNYKKAEKYKIKNMSWI